MGLQLEHVFAGEGMGSGKVQRQTVVYGRAIAVTKRQVGGLAGHKRARAQRLHQARQTPARNTHDAHRTAPGGGGDGNNRFLVAGKHAGIVQETRAADAALEGSRVGSSGQLT